MRRMHQESFEYNTQEPLSVWLAQREDPWDRRAHALLVRLSTKAKRVFTIRARDSKGPMGAAWRALSWVVFLLTLGRHWIVDNPYYMVSGPTIWCPGNGEKFKAMAPRERFGVILHECVHLSHRYLGDPCMALFPSGASIPPSAGYAWAVGAPTWWWKATFQLKYMFWPFPLWASSFRRAAEYHAYKSALFLAAAHVMRYEKQNVSSEEFSEILRQKSIYTSTEDWIASALQGIAYGFMHSEASAKKDLSLMLVDTYAAYRAGALDDLSAAYLEVEARSPNA